MTISDIASATEERPVYLKFNGSDVYISRMYGFSVPNEPLLITDAADYDFGMQTEDATKTFTVTNKGRAAMNNLHATFADGTHYTATVGKTTLQPQESTTITVTQKHNLADLGTHSDVLTIGADDVADVTVNLSGATRDPSKLYIDFENGNNFPSDWRISSAWNIWSYGSNGYAYKYGPSTIITAPLTVAEGETMTFQTGWYSGSNGTLKIRYSMDGGVNWSETQDFSSYVQKTDWKTVTLSGIPAGTAIIEFTCNGIKLDNISGFTLGAQMPVVTLAEGTTTIENKAEKDFGNLSEESGDKSTTYTLTNVGTATLKSTIQTTGVLSAQPATIEVAPGKSAQITVTMPFGEPFGDRTGQLVINSEGGVGQIVLNYKGNAIDPTLFYEDFTSNTIPTGFYSNGWTYSNGDATNSSGKEATLITYKLAVAGESDVLSFDARAYWAGYDEQIVVSYSTDRENWNELTTLTKAELTGEYQTFTLSGLPKGEYYLQFRGTRVYLDNLLGWHFVSPKAAHDLYVVSSELPTDDIIPGTDYTAKLDVASLCDAEEVTATLYFDNQAVAETTLSIAKNATETITLTGAAPEDEADHQVYVKLSYAEGAVTTDTKPVQVTTKHIRTLAVTKFEAVNTEVTANENNMFEAAFDITLLNDGSISQNQDNIKMIITNDEGTEVASLLSYKNLAPGEEISIGITINQPALEGGKFNYHIKAVLNDDAEFPYEGVATIDVTSSGARLQVADAKGNQLQDGNMVNLGAVVKKTSLSFNLSNVGQLPMTINSITATEGFSVTPTIGDDGQTLPNDDSTLGMTISFDPTKGAKGMRNGKVTISYMVDPIYECLFTFQVKGFAIDEEKIYLDFSDSTLPAGWQNNGWTIADGKATAGIDAELITPAVIVEEGEQMALGVRATKSFQELFYYTSTDGGKTWSEKSQNLASQVTSSETSIIFIEGLEAGNYKIKLQGYGVSLDFINGFHLDESAPEMAVSFDGNTIGDEATAKFGKVRTQPEAKTYTIQNVGTGTLQGTITTSDEAQFTVSETSFSLAKGEQMQFDINLVFTEDYGDKQALITIHPENEGLSDVVITATATTADPNVWDEDFAEGIPVEWINDGFKTDNYGHAEEAYVTMPEGTLITPRLLATKGQVLQFDVICPWSDPLTAEWSNSRKGEWTAIDTYTESGTQSFTAPADGYYYLRFKGSFVGVDNFKGFKLEMPEHDIEIAGQDMPTEATQYDNYTATVTVREYAGKTENVEVSLIIDNETVATENVTLTPGAESTVELTCRLQNSGTVETYIEVAYDGGKLTSEKSELSIEEVFALDENSTASTVDPGDYNSLMLLHTFEKGWGTLCLPFEVSDIEELLGKGALAYEFTGYQNNGTLQFTRTTTLKATIPYVIYIPETITDPIVLSDITIEDTDYRAGFTKINNMVYFVGSFTRMNAGTLKGYFGVTSEGKIVKCGSGATMKGFRGYFQLPAGVKNARMVVDDNESTGVQYATTRQQESGRIYNVQGQRVDTPHKKGLYIIDGKKVVVK
ncbi:MAG: DUF1573 domain-containing protein [Prevotella sp.]|nr:DUF1573 domain-containing protein [Prevotella sp.]